MSVLCPGLVQTNLGDGMRFRGAEDRTGWFYLPDDMTTAEVDAIGVLVADAIVPPDDAPGASAAGVVSISIGNLPVRFTACALTIQRRSLISSKSAARAQRTSSSNSAKRPILPSFST